MADSASAPAPAPATGRGRPASAAPGPIELADEKTVQTLATPDSFGAPLARLSPSPTGHGYGSTPPSASTAASGSPPRPDSPHGIPEEYRCRMSSVIMRDPVVAADGLSYERRFIEKWLRDGNRSSPVTREPLRFPHLYPNQHLRTLIQRRPHGGSSIAALHIADPHFKQMDPNERRTAEVEWFVAKPNRGGYGVAKSDVDGKVFFAESTVRDEPGGYGVPASGRKISYKVDPNDQTVQVEGVDHTKGIDVEVLAVRKPPSPRNRPPLNSRERIRGTCTWFSDQCKYGYLRPDDTSKPDVFVHAAALTDLGNTLRSGDRCEFRVATYNGRQRAVNVVGVDGFTGYDYDEYTGDLIRRGGDGRDVPAFAVPPVPQTAPARYGAEPFFARPAGLPAARAAPPSFDLPPLGAPTPRAAEWPGSAPPPGMAPPGVPRVTPRNYPLFGSEDSATGDSSQSRGGGGSIDWRP